MTNENEHDLLSWLGLRRKPDYSKARWLGGLITLLLALLILALVIPTVIEFLQAIMGKGEFEDDTAQSEAIRNTGLVLAAIVGVPFIVWRTLVAQQQVQISEQGQITDRINKAVEGLGAVKETNRIGRSVEILEIPPGFEPDDSVDAERLRNPPKRTEIQWQGEPSPVQPTETQGKVGQWEVFTASEPNLEVRLGAIYALERISQDSARDHIQIMEILCAYIRQNAGRETVPLPASEPTPAEWTPWRQDGREHPRLDVDVALKVIERRDETRKQLERDKGYRLGLERARLSKIILEERDLTGADLRTAELQGADLSRAKLQGADLWFAKLQGADLWAAKLQGADLRLAQLQGVDLGEAELQGADLGEAELHGASLI